MEVMSKLPDVGTTIFTVMSRMAAEHDAINLSQGYPDFSVPDGLIERLSHHMHAGHNQYPPTHGIPALREAISQKCLSHYGIQVDPEEEITITSGATEALFVAIQAVVDDDDEVILLDPAYDSYEPAVRLAGGRAIHLPLVAPDFRVDWEAVRGAITPKTRLIVINSPHNPTGATLASNDLDELAALVADSRILVLSDEVYEHMVFDGAIHQTLAAHDALRERSMVVSSFGKTYHATGWKVGYCIAPAGLTREFRKVHQFVTFTTHTPTQWALADYLTAHPEHHQTLPAFYQDKRDHFLSVMSDIGFRMTPSTGTSTVLGAMEWIAHSAQA